ncbi:glutamate--tRNA ligase [Swaminathania salitolerans]|uniref:Glutamate--tRNA ligase n=1 Tax=Swaminathania salitolerans TaxID=182838 RepID=A0A511BYR1_9PROT|nr:glutamate--tRNA ligase [Swaminathania salitolerans]GBQ12728.1 glutamyl-tRNA synthetase [Swaminathania salitolerans LMG 21291]GEL03148.1 glutamate--tRNA ligase 2 [Swaminathania salitolerans]
MKLRFAPSPTGYLHVGNARLAIANALYARRHGARFLLRIDDTDRERSKPEYEQGIKTDLEWLGLGWDEIAHQSDRLDRYALAIEALKASGRLYPCFESEHELAAKREARLKARKPPIYDRAMLRLTPEQRERAEANGKTPYWRFRLSDGHKSWNDLVMGDLSVKLTAISDPVLVRADGTVLYTLASVVDDMEMGVSHIIRGEDHITNTGVQLDIIEALGGRPGHFSFAHLPLLLDEGGGKLSKRFDALSLRALRHDGMEPQSLVSYLSRIGSSDDPVPMTLEQSIASYDLSHMSRSAARFDMTHLLGLNRRLLHGLAFEDVRARLPEGATEAFWETIRGNVDLTGEIAFWWEVVQGEIASPSLSHEAAFLEEARETLPPEPWNGESWKLWIEALKQRSGRKGKALFLPIRLALTGEEAGPELHGLMPLMGRERVLRRLRDAARA